MKRFDFVIGNPPYQDETLGDNKGFAPPVYDKFLSEGYKVGERVMMIHPARFLFNAGTTPKAWNTKMLNDPHSSSDLVMGRPVVMRAVRRIKNSF